jgi:hypothetical protein
VSPLKLQFHFLICEQWLPGLFVPPRRNREFRGRYELDRVYMKVGI